MPYGEMEQGQLWHKLLACCLMTLDFYLNQYWLITNEILWHSIQVNFYLNTEDVIFETHTVEITAHLGPDSI